MYEEKQIASFIQTLLPLTNEFSKDCNANHVIIQCIAILKQEYINSIYLILKRDLIEISITKFGCCTVQKCLDNLTGMKKEKIIKKIIKHYEVLMTNSNGSYVIQYILNLKKSNYCTELITLITSSNLKLLDYCNNKISSTILEKCLENLDEADKSILVEALINNSTIIESLSNDANGIYSKCLILIFIYNCY